MKLLLISTTIFPLPPAGYAGTENIVFNLACGLAAKGHQVSVMAPEGSRLPAGVELLACKPGESEESAYARLYRERIEKGEWEVIGDHSFEAWSYMSSIGREPQLPIVHTVHTHNSIYQKPPPVQWPRFVGISDSHCRLLSLALGIAPRRVYNGIDLDFYKPDPSVSRNGRYLAFGRFTAEKGMLHAILLAKRLRLALDAVGDVNIVASKEYVDRCREACDGLQVRFQGGVSRQDAVTLYRTHRALLFPLQWDEPFGLVPVEAAACGLPVLTLSRGAMPEVVKDGVSGFVCENERELEDKLTSGALGSLEPEKIRGWAKQFSLEQMVASYAALYAEAAQGIKW